MTPIRLFVLPLAAMVYLLLVSNLYADTSTIIGIITEGQSKSPVENVVISIGDKSSTTDSQGRFIISNLPFGFYTVEIKENRFDGRTLSRVQIEVDQRRIKRDFRLH